MTKWRVRSRYGTTKTASSTVYSYEIPDSSTWQYANTTTATIATNAANYTTGSYSNTMAAGTLSMADLVYAWDTVTSNSFSTWTSTTTRLWKQQRSRERSRVFTWEEAVPPDLSIAIAPVSETECDPVDVEIKEQWVKIEVWDEPAIAITVWRAWNKEGDYTDNVVTHEVLADCELEDVEDLWREWVAEAVQELTGSSFLPAELQTYHHNLQTAAEIERARKRRELEAARQRRVEEEARKKAEEFKIAEKRAKTLLLQNLDPDQRSTFKKVQGFTVVSESGNKYFIQSGRQHNIFRLDSDGRRIEELCVHVAEFVPNADNILAQKLLLEGHEDELRRMANIWDLTSNRALISKSGQPAPLEARELVSA